MVEDSALYFRRDDVLGHLDCILQYLSELHDRARGYVQSTRVLQIVDDPVHAAAPFFRLEQRRGVFEQLRSERAGLRVLQCAELWCESLEAFQDEIDVRQRVRKRIVDLVGHACRQGPERGDA